MTLERINGHVMRRLGVSRRELFESVERPALAPLPDADYEFAEWRLARVALDYHVEVEGFFYSVPHALIREQVDVRITARTIELFHRGKRVAAHQRRYGGRRHGTDPDHMPSAHRRYAEWTPERFRRWARSIGPNTEGLVIAMLANRPHPEQGFRTCLGVLRLFRGLDPARAEAVAARAVAIGALTYKSIASILANKLDRAHPPSRERGGDRPPQSARPRLLPLTETIHMLTHPTLELLHTLGLHGMAKGFKELDAQPEARGLDHAEWLGLLLEHEMTLRHQKRFERRARAARLRHQACVEDVDYRAARGLDRALFLKLATCDWIRARRNLLITGPCGVGKSWLACALGHKACREDFVRPLPSCAAPVRRPRARPRRWPICQAAAIACPRRTAHPRRLGTRTAHRRAAARSPRDRRGSLRYGRRQWWMGAQHRSLHTGRRWYGPNLARELAKDASAAAWQAGVANIVVRIGREIGRMLTR